MAAEPDTPLVSVVIPTYDRLPLLREAVASVRAQAYPRWELVVADDGSTDRTVEWVRSLADSRVRCLALAHGGNVARARNAGVRASGGEYVAFLDSDDVWLPGKLEAQVRALASGAARWCYAGFEMMDTGGRTIPFVEGDWKPLSGRIAREVITTEAAVGIATLVVERSLFDEVGGFDEDPGLVLREDLDLAIRLALAADTVAVPAVLARVREHPGRSTAACSDADALERMARVYDRVLASTTDPELLRLATLRRDEHLAARAVAGRPVRT
jgi:glycosyltransferase involved in cell wall biosynthesis